MSHVAHAPCRPLQQPSTAAHGCRTSRCTHCCALGRTSCRNTPLSCPWQHPRATTPFYHGSDRSLTLCLYVLSHSLAHISIGVVIPLAQLNSYMNKDHNLWFTIQAVYFSKPSKKEKGKSMAEIAGTRKVDNEAAKLNAKTEKPKKEQVKADNKVEDEDEDDSDDEEDVSEDSDSDEDMVGAQEDSSEEDDDDSSEEEASPEKVDTGKKRKPDSASKTPIHDKKAKIVTPAQNQKTGGDGKKGGHVHIATPYPSKQGVKPQQTPKSGGSVICKSCNRKPHIKAISYLKRHHWFSVDGKLRARRMHSQLVKTSDDNLEIINATSYEDYE
ncbi:Histone deacetylase HDT1 [Platanthera guangdongensis]|uniref:Histone deacetylase HDT1 n=1 Tax=Platanthera guangdongensis TaxID=2320717 RepID=A0ABR2N2S6_9ASPA